MRIVYRVKLWWAGRLRFWRNKKILTKLAREMAEFQIDLRYGFFENNVETYRRVKEAHESALLQDDLFTSPEPQQTAVIMPFERYAQRTQNAER